MGRFRAAADLSYHLSQAMRHAIQLEAYLVHGLDTSDPLLMLAEDMTRASAALLTYRSAMEERIKHEAH